MTLATGTRLGPYEILGQLGAGGMGEVWRARDAALDREIAIKILPASVAGQPERLARFDREARVLASLNHPNIAGIYGFHESPPSTGSGQAVRFLAMELVPGEDLSDRIARGALPVEEAIEIARQVAEALETAHEQGIVHRDLKPANVRVTPGGQVKVLDFGLAKALDPGAAMAGDDIAMSPTITSLGTVAGVLLGTAAYMSPEQARGKPADRRADIWAFGVILFEMLTGSRLFAGETVSDTLAAILKTDLDFGALPPVTPPAVRNLVRRCLERDPRQRLRDIGEARVLLSGGLEAGAPPARPTARSRASLAWGLFAIAAVAAAALGAAFWLRPAAPARGAKLHVRKFTIETAVVPADNTRSVEISPDGTRLVFESDRGIELRDMGETSPHLLVPAADLPARQKKATPFWSRDGATIGYASGGSLWKIPATGGSPTVVCKLPGDWNGGVWLSDDRIAFATTRGPMYRVAARGGDPEILLPLAEKGELDFHQPSVLPDGESLLYTVHRNAGVDTIEMLRGGKRTVVLRVDPGRANVQDSPHVVNVPYYSPSGHVLYQRHLGNPGLWAVPFSVQKGATTGEPFLVAAGMGFPSVAVDGTVVCAGLPRAGAGQLILVGRDGAIERALGEPMPELGSPSFSPDGRRLLFAAAEQQSRDLYLWDIDEGRKTRLTTTPEPEDDPVWIPGGDRIAFSAPAETCRSVFAMNADGTGARELLAKSATSACFHPGGKEFVYETFCEDRRGLNRMVVGSGAPVPLVDAPAGIDSPALSPDGRYLAYRNWEGGNPQIYVSRYPSMDGRWFVATTYSPPRWASGGSEILCVDGQSGRMISVPVRLDPVFSTGTPRPLFDAAALAEPSARFDVSPDGKRFVLVREKEGDHPERRILVIENAF